MSRKLLLLPLLLIPLPALAADGASASTIIGAAAAAVLACAVLIGMPKTRAWGVAAGSLVGIVIAGYLTAQHGSTGASVCNVSDVWSCDTVNRSEYAVIGGRLPVAFLGEAFYASVPVALLGVAFYAMMAWLSLRHASGGALKAPAMMLALSGAALAFDGYLAWASTRIGAFCPLCVASWALNLVLLGGAGLLWRASAPADRSIPTGVQTEFWSVAIVGLLTLVAGSVASHDGAKGSAAAGGASAGGVEDLSQHYEAVTGRIELDGTEPVIGPADAKFVMVEWADFECPYCAVMSEEMKKILAENPDVKLYFKHYPISEKCNSFVQGERHLNACNAAAAAECSRLQGRFWELSRQMFKNQEFLGKEDIRFMAEQQQIDMTAFEACMADSSTSEAIKQDVAAGGIAGVEGTPSIFVKGVYGDGYVRFSTMDKDAINAVLAAARAGQSLPAPRPHQEH
jgi:protein-disulfide isomerase/uncharacterized membrane protein